jgi:hypothetical protein
MDRRMQKALDGELPIEKLTPAQREELATYQLAVAEVVSQMPDPGPAPDITGAVMWRIAHPAAPERRRTAPNATDGLAWLRWLWRPYPIRLRPVAVLATVALLVAGGLALSGVRPRPGTTAQAAVANQLVQFRLGADGVREVALVGDFGGWNVRYPMEQVAPGVWSTAVPLEPGVYDYAFVVDGTTWILDPLAPSVSDGFGGANSRLSVLAPDVRTRT